MKPTLTTAGAEALDPGRPGAPCIYLAHIISDISKSQRTATSTAGATQIPDSPDSSSASPSIRNFFQPTLTHTCVSCNCIFYEKIAAHVLMNAKCSKGSLI